MKKLRSYSIFIVVVFAACKPSDKLNKVVGITKVTLENTRWALIELDAQAITFENKPYLMFAPKSMVVNGFGGCNQLAGSYQSSAQKLKLNNIAATRIYCPETMQTEIDFLQRLQQITNFRIEGHELILLYDNIVVARFRAVN
ncbi:MAG: META domain-containing protein [Cyclobacteriaceae bacterium]|nr:META domain-containing protein [Cyclobacteriaceae bacterium]